MDRTQVRVHLLKIMSLVLAGTTWVFCSFIFSTRPEQAQVDPLTALVRLPASLPAQLPAQLPAVFAPGNRVPEVIRMDTLAVSCWDRRWENGFLSEARWVRLTGRACQGDAGAEEVTVRNLTNGYVATVFAAQPQLLTTDFIPLEVGANDIEVHIKQGAGLSFDNKFVVTRQ